MGHMSGEAWLFLFGAVSSIGALASIGQFWLQVRQWRRSMMTGTIAQPELKASPEEPARTLPEGGAFPISRTRLAVITLLLVLSTALCLGGFVSSIQRKEELNVALRAEHIQTTIRQWLDGFGYSSTITTDPASDFRILVRTPAGDKPITITREKRYNQYIAIGASVIVSPEHQALIANLSEKEKNHYARTVLIELHRFGADSTQVLPSQVVFFKRIPITNALTEDSLIKTINSVESFESLLIETILREIGQ